MELGGFSLPLVVLLLAAGGWVQIEVRGEGGEECKSQMGFCAPESIQCTTANDDFDCAEGEICCLPLEQERKSIKSRIAIGRSEGSRTACNMAGGVCQSACREGQGSINAECLNDGDSCCASVTPPKPCKPSESCSNKPGHHCIKLSSASQLGILSQCDGNLCAGFCACCPE